MNSAVFMQLPSVDYNESQSALQDDASRRYMIQEDDETFQKYAGVCIEEWGRQGKNTKPMKLYMDTLEKYGSSVTRRV